LQKKWDLLARGWVCNGGKTAVPISVWRNVCSHTAKHQSELLAWQTGVTLFNRLQHELLSRLLPCLLPHLLAQKTVARVTLPLRQARVSQQAGPARQSGGRVWVCGWGCGCGGNARRTYYHGLDHRHRAGLAHTRCNSGASTHDEITFVH
jgi:hypothetical protein